MWSLNVQFFVYLLVLFSFSVSPCRQWFVDCCGLTMDFCLSGLKANPTDRSVFSPHVCNCWCTQWAEFHIRRPTGNFSWIVRLQNEQDLMAMFPDFALSDISNLFLPFSTGEVPEPSPSGDTGR